MPSTVLCSAAGTHVCVLAAHSYEACYPAIQKGTHGVVLVYNPDNRGHEKEIEIWYAVAAALAGGSN